MALSKRSAIPGNNDDKAAARNCVVNKMPESNLKLEKYDGQEGLSLLYKDWLLLMENVHNRCFYHDPDWFSAYFSSREVIEPPISFFAVRRGGELVAVVPLQRKPGLRLTQPTLLMVPVESQLYMPDCAIAATEDPSRIVTYVLDNISREFGWSWDRLTVSHTLQDSLIARALTRQSARKFLTDTKGACSIVPIRPYEALLKRMKAKFRQNLNRAKRKVASLEAAEFSVAMEFGDVIRTFEEFIVLEASGWKGGKGQPRGDVKKPSAIALNEKKRRFYDFVIRAFAVRRKAEIFCVRVDGKLIGAEVWLVLGDRCFAMKTAYDESFSRMSPGVIAFDLGYQRHAAAGVATSINTITSTPAVDDWLPEKLSIQNIDVFNSTIRGRLMAAGLTIRNWMRRRL